MAENDFTHVGVTKETQKKISILAKVLDEKMYELVELWANSEWDSAEGAGLVTRAMLGNGQASAVSEEQEKVTA